MSTIITRNSANSGSVPSSLVQGELAINVTDGRLFYGSGSGNVVKEFTGSASGGTIDTGSFVTTSSFNNYTGSNTSQFAGTASYATNALTASYAISASYEINYETSSSYADFAVSASHALRADDAATLDLYSFTVPTNSYLLFSNTIAATGVAVGGNNDLRYNSSTKTLSAVNISATTLTGSLLGTASYATTALSASFASTASYVQNAQTASYVLNAVSASFASTASYVLNAVSASFASTASYVVNAQTASFVTASNVYGPYGSNSVISASYALNGGVTQLLAGPNIALSPTNGLGQVTITATLSGSNSYNTATGSYGSFYDTTTQTNPVANIARSMSFNSTDITNGVSISGSASPFNTYIKTENAGVYDIQFSAQVDKTDGGTDDIVIWLRKNGIDLTDTATTLTLPTNNSKVVAAWNWFVSSATGDYYQIIWRSADTDLRLLAEPISIDHPGIPSVILTVNRVDQFLSNTGSFTGSFTGALTGTASYASQALSSSYATTASYVLQAVSASYATNSLSASFASTASYIQNAQTASYVLQAVSASFASTASFVRNAQTASYVLNAVSASYATQALTASNITPVISNDADIRIITANGNGTLNGESNLTFNGSLLNVAGNLLVTSSAAIGTSSLGPFENTLTLGARDTGNEGGQIGFNAPGGTYTSASFIDNWSNYARILRGTNASSTGLVAQWNLHTLQMQLPAYTAASSFPGTATANLAVDSAGNVITVSTTGGSVFPYVGNAVITGSLTTTGIIYAQPNGGMYFQGGDDAALYDINVANTMGIYGMQTVTEGAIKLGSNGPVLHGSGSRLGIGTTTPTSASLTVNGNVWATSFTGSLLGTATTASYVLNAVSASFATLAQTANTASYVVTAQTASYVLQAVSASYATTASYSNTSTSASYALSASYAPSTPAFPYTGSALITGSLGITGSLSNGIGNISSGIFSHAEGTGTVASGSYSHAEGGGTIAIGDYSHSEGESTTATGQASHAEGESTTATGRGSHAEGGGTIAIGDYSHAEGESTTATGRGSHAEGLNTIASGSYSHAEGESTTSTGVYSHAEGYFTIASGSYSHAEGRGTIATGQASHAEGLSTIATADYQHVQGQFNITSSAQSAFIVGNGTISSRSNLIFAAGSQVEITGSLVVTAGITGSLLGTASYATQALSASYAPSTPAFPYNGNAQISGSLGVTGSFAVQTYDGIFANAFVDAIRISDGGRAIYDIFGTGSIDAGGRVLIDNMFLPSLSWLSRTLYDTSPESSIDWGNRIAYDATGTTYSIDWNNRLLVDPTTISSIDWSSRELLNSAGDAAITWNYLSQAQAIEINSYTRKTLELGTVVENFSNLPVYAAFQPDGEILKGVALDASVADFDLVYLETDGKWYPVDVTTNSSSKLLGIAWNVGTGKETVLIEGTMVVNNSALTDSPQVLGVDHGLPIYIRNGSGAYMSTTAPGASGNYVRVLGHAYYQGVADSNYWVMKFRPANDWYII